MSTPKRRMKSAIIQSLKPGRWMRVSLWVRREIRCCGTGYCSQALMRSPRVAPTGSPSMDSVLGRIVAHRRQDGEFGFVGERQHQRHHVAAEQVPLGLHEHDVITAG